MEDVELAKELPKLGPWAEDAACRGMNPNVFLPKIENEDSCRHAKSVCARCPQREPCLDYALEYNPRGVWGGATQADRRRIRAKRRRSQAPVVISGPETRCPGCRAVTAGLRVGGRTKECPHCGARWPA